jgi:hypothetical protein
VIKNKKNKNYVPDLLSGDSSDSEYSCHGEFRDATPPASGGAERPTEESREALLRKLQRYDAEQSAFQAQILKRSLNSVFM